MLIDAMFDTPRHATAFIRHAIADTLIAMLLTHATLISVFHATRYIRCYARCRCLYLLLFDYALMITLIDDATPFTLRSPRAPPCPFHALSFATLLMPPCCYATHAYCCRAAAIASRRHACRYTLLPRYFAVTA